MATPKPQKKQEEKRQARIDAVIAAAGEKMAASEGPPHILLHTLVRLLLSSCHAAAAPGATVGPAFRQDLPPTA